MTNPRKSLDGEVPWTEVLRVLGLPLRSQALPATTQCPFCNRPKLRIYRDATLGGHWHHCQSCLAAGDMIELAQRVWDTDAMSALFRLAGADVPIPKYILDRDEVDAYVETNQTQRKKMLSMWEQARKRMASTKLGAVRGLQTMHRLRLQCGRDRWENGPGQLIGSLPVKTINQTLQPKSTGDGSCSVSEKRIFGGRKWDEALVFPYYDLPGRIRAFMFLGRSGDQTQDQVFKLIRVANADPEPDSGLGGLRALDLTGNPATVIATDNWLLALQAQMRTFNVAMMPLPLVVWHDDGKTRTTSSWHALGDRNIIFWAVSTLDARLVRQAMQVDGFISLTGPERDTEEDLRYFLKEYPGFDLTTMIRRRSLPWRQALAKWMKTSRESVVDQLLLDLEKAGENVGEILKQCGRKSKVAGLPVVTRSVEIGSKVVVERGGQWFEELKTKRLRLIADAAIRITHVIRDKHSNGLYYRGYVLYGGERLHFLDPVGDFDKSPTLWLRNLVARAGLGLVKYTVTWGPRFYEIAAAFSEPKLVTEELSEVARVMRQRKELVDPI